MRRAFSTATFVILPEKTIGCPLGSVLLIRHKRLGLWLPVGGEMEANETPLEAAQRELLEETGLRVGHDAAYPMLRDSYDENVPLGFLGYEEHDAGAKGYHMNFSFVAITQTREIKGDGSFEGIVWYPIGDRFVESEEHRTAPNVHFYLRRIHELRHKRKI